MHVISRKRLKDAALRHPQLEAPLDTWFRITKRAAWRSLADVRNTWSSAGAVGKWTVFNIKGNQYRLIAEINYSFGRVYVRAILTHADYSEGGWKR